LVERDDRASVSTFYVDADLTANVVTLGEDVAHHARVKRLGAGDRVQLTNGRGAVADAAIASLSKNAMNVSLECVRAVPPPFAIHLRAPIADRDRMLFLAEKATELGITSWQSVRFKRSMSVSPRGEGPGFAAKLRARMIAALEQSGGAWLPTLLDETSVSSVQGSTDEIPIVLDAWGESLASVTSETRAGGVVILVGPEGGIEAEELRKLSDAGWRRVRLAPNTLRFETAGIAAIAAIRAIRQSEEK
jgi:16S rRNA (uracil1498-N3)-methyltransferase